MTHYPAPNQPYYPQYGQPPASFRPTSVTVIAVVGIVFGIIGILCKPAALLPLLIPANMGPPNPALEMMRDPQIMGYTMFIVIVGVPISILLLSASIASLSLKRWARKAMVVYALVAMLMCAVNMVAQIAFIGPRMAELQGQTPGMPAMPSFAQPGNVVLVVGEFVLRMIFPVLVLVFISRPHVKAAFDSGGASPYAGAGYGPAQGAPYGSVPYGGPPPGGYYAPQPPQPPPPGSYPPPPQA